MKKSKKVPSVIDKNCVLVLSAALYQPIGFTTIRKALKSMFSQDHDAAQALDLTYPLKENGEIDFSAQPTAIPTNITEWLKLSVRDFDIPIHSTNNRVYRAPIILLTHNVKKMLTKKIKPTRRNVWEFYDKKCIWTGRELSYSECTREHMKPKSEGGTDSWSNIAPAAKKINNERGSIPVEKWKYKQQYKLKEPREMPVSTFIRTAVRPEWQYFLINK